MEDKVIDIEELAQDAHNFNKGNKSQQAAIAAGIKKVRVIETTGDELVAVKRTDVDIDSAEGRKMAYLDIRAPFTQGGGLRRGCGKMVGHLGKILAKKSVQVWPMVN